MSSGSSSGSRSGPLGTCRVARRCGRGVIRGARCFAQLALESCAAPLACSATRVARHCARCLVRSSRCAVRWSWSVRWLRHAVFAARWSACRLRWSASSHCLRVCLSQCRCLCCRRARFWAGRRGRTGSAGSWDTTGSRDPGAVAYGVSMDQAAAAMAQDRAVAAMAQIGRRRRRPDWTAVATA